MPPSSDGLVVLPYFAGERTPLQDARARGLISGLTLSHGRGHLYRAMLEATACGVRHIFEAMGEAGGGGERLGAVGSGTKGACGPRSSPTSRDGRRTCRNRPSGRATATPTVQAEERKPA